MSEEAELSNRSVGRAAIWATLANTSGQFLSLIMFLILSRFVEPADYGAVAIAIVIVELFRQLGVDPPAMAVLSKEKPTERDFNACFLMTVSYAVIVAIALYFSADLIAEALGRPKVADAVEPIAALLVLIALWRTHEAWLTRQMRFRALFFRMLAASFVGGSVGVGLGIMGFEMWALIAQQLLFAGTTVIAMWLSSSWRPQFRTDWSLAAELVRFARPIGVGMAFNLLGKQTDVVICGFFLGLERAGVYNGAKRLNLALQLMLNTALMQIALPSLARVSSDKNKMRSAFVKSLSIVSFVTAPIYLGVSAVSYDLVDLLFGDAWSDVAPILAILALAGVFHALEELIVATFLANDRPKWMMYFNSASALANLVVIVLAAPYGLIAMATAYTLRVALVFPIVFVAALRLVNVSVWEGVQAIIGSVFAAAAMMGTVLLLRDVLDDWSVWARLPTLVFAGAAAYFIYSIIFNRTVLWLCRDIALQIADRSEKPA